MELDAPLLVVSSEPLQEAARRVLLALRELPETSPRLAIAGGSVQGAVGHLRRLLGDGDWARLRLTWVDERCVPFDDQDSNRGTAYRSHALEAESPPTDELPLFLDGETPDTARQRVEEAVLCRFQGKLDVLLLGMGEDGHIASLFPGHPVLDAPGVVAAIADSPKPPSARITLTLHTLGTATHAILLATGVQKRAAIERLRARDPALPGSALRRLTIVTG